MSENDKKDSDRELDELDKSLSDLERARMQFLESLKAMAEEEKRKPTFWEMAFSIFVTFVFPLAFGTIFVWFALPGQVGLFDSLLATCGAWLGILAGSVLSSYLLSRG